MSNLIQPEVIHTAVRERYGQIAETRSSCCGSGAQSSCCSPAEANTEASDKYCGAELYQTDLSQLPADVTQLSLGCGDPLTIANLQPGQTVLDLGSGGGIDCFLSAQKVGTEGFVIGVDMTPQMIERANQNKAKVGATNVEFRLGQIEALPVADNSVDVIISNCVVNLSPHKPAVFQEAYRVLKPGGKLAISDMITLGQYTPAERANLAAWSECMTGAEPIEYYHEQLLAAGFKEVHIQEGGENGQDLTPLVRQPYTEQTRLLSARIQAYK